MSGPACRPGPGASPEEMNERTSLFYDINNKEYIATAKAVCATCPVQIKRACLEQGMSEAYGIWGGLTPMERARLRARRNK